MVLPPGIEPGSLAATDFKSVVFTYFTKGAFRYLFICAAEPRRSLWLDEPLTVHHPRCS